MARPGPCSDDEIKLLWPAFDRVGASPGTAAAFRVLLLSGQRPGEVAGMAPTSCMISMIHARRYGRYQQNA